MRTTFSAFKVVANQDSVVIDSRAEYVDHDGETSHVASCDIYDFVDGRLAGITSYTVRAVARLSTRPGANDPT